MSTYCSPNSSSGAARVDDSNLSFVAEIIQCEDFLLILQQDNLEKKREMMIIDSFKTKQEILQALKHYK